MTTGIKWQIPETDPPAAWPRYATGAVRLVLAGAYERGGEKHVHFILKRIWNTYRALRGPRHPEDVVTLYDVLNADVSFSDWIDFDTYLTTGLDTVVPGWGAALADVVVPEGAGRDATGRKRLVIARYGEPDTRAPVHDLDACIRTLRRMDMEETEPLPHERFRFTDHKWETVTLGSDGVVSIWSSDWDLMLLSLHDDGGIVLGVDDRGPGVGYWVQW
jgi:hypothetical protein